MTNYKAESYTRTGNGKMAAHIRDLAKSCHLTVNSFSASGWVLKTIKITVYGHVDDLAKFDKQIPDGIAS